MTINVLITRTDGTVRMMGTSQAMIDADNTTLEKLIARVVEPGETWKVLTDAEVARLPSDYFFNAWKLSQGKIEVDTSRAAEVKMQRLRHYRNLELKDQDSYFTQSQEKAVMAKIEIDEAKNLGNVADYKLKQEMARPAEEQNQVLISEYKNQIETSRQKRFEHESLLSNANAELKTIAKAKQALRDMPKTTDISRFDLKRMETYIPPELAHRDDIK